MKEKIYQLIDAINRSGIDNGYWGVIDCCANTCVEFGTKDVHQLYGKWLYVYSDDDGSNPVTAWNPSVLPDHTFDTNHTYPNGIVEKIYMFKLED